MAFKIYLDQTIVRIIDTDGRNEPMQFNPGVSKYYVKAGQFIFFDGVQEQDFNNHGYADFQDKFGNTFASEAAFIEYLNSFINLHASGVITNPAPGFDIDPNGRMGLNTVFGDRISATRHSTIAAQFQYGLPSGDADPEIENGGVIDFYEAMIRVQTGTNVAGSAKIQSSQTVRYTPGQEVYCFFTAVFSPGVADSFQRIGLYDVDNGFFVGYAGTQFTFTRRRDGVDYPQAINLADFEVENGYVLDPTKGNIYKISYGYLGFAPIILEVMKPGGGFALLSKINYPNSETVTHTTQTFLPVNGEVANTGNDTNITLMSGSIAAGIVNGGISGPDDTTARRFSWANEATYTVTGNTELVAFRNKEIFNSITNYVEARLVMISGANELNKNARWKLYKNPTVVNTPTWTDVQTGDSTLEYSEDIEIDFAASMELYLAWNVFKISDFFEKVGEFVLDLPPGGIAAFVIETDATGGDADLAIRWDELF